MIFGRTPTQAVIFFADVKCHQAVGYISPTRYAIESAKHLCHKARLGSGQDALE